MAWHTLTNMRTKLKITIIYLSFLFYCLVLCCCCCSYDICHWVKNNKPTIKMMIIIATIEPKARQMCVRVCVWSVLLCWCNQQWDGICQFLCDVSYVRMVVLVVYIFFYLSRIDSRDSGQINYNHIDYNLQSQLHMHRIYHANAHHLFTWKKTKEKQQQKQNRRAKKI